MSLTYLNALYSWQYSPTVKSIEETLGCQSYPSLLRKTRLRSTRQSSAGSMSRLERLSMSKLRLVIFRPRDVEQGFVAGLLADTASQGAILFTSIISCLSWSNLSRSHWSGPALWYAGIILSLTSVVLGAQQTLELPEASGTIDALTFKRRLTARHSNPPTPSRIMLFALQAPFMCMTYSIALFLAGLTSVVLSPLARQPMWDDDAKVSSFFFWAMVTRRSAC